MFGKCLTRPSVWRGALHAPSPIRAFSQSASRLGYSVPGLSNEVKYQQEGVQKVFSPTAFESNWTNYQKGLLDKLNEYVAGTDLDNKSPLDVAIATARQADLATVFNLASQAHNNHFFFRNLSPVQTVMPARLAELVRRVFTTPENFKTEFTTTAASLFGSGWVWLVFDESRKLRILATYNAGTPYSDAYRRQNVDLNTNADPARYTTNFQESFQVGRTGSQVNRVTYPLPLLCCKVWEHAWIQDFGVDGKEKYLDAWWDSIDWNSVDAAIPEGSDITRSRIAFDRAGSQFGATGFVNE